MHASLLGAGTTSGLLRDLIRINSDIARGLREASLAVRDGVLRGRLEQFATRRDGDAAELREVVADVDENETRLANATGEAWRPRWSPLARVRAAGGDSTVALTLIERAELFLRSCYEHALRRFTQRPAAAALQRQHAQVRREHEIIRDLRDLMMD